LASCQSGERDRPWAGRLFRPGCYRFDLLNREFASLFEPFFPVRELEPWGFEPVGITPEKDEALYK
jgi:hypothetical protein